MLVMLLLAAQAVAGPPAPRPERPRTAKPCPAETEGTDEVVVCARVDGDEHRLKPLPDRAEPMLPRAAARIGAGEVAADTEQAGVGGFPSNRVMLRLKLPF